ncbi:uncharacterized protein NMK_1667 [Novimethylophilus kurashikiensis]|uniref:Uncharacterized protein n=1 Tax=Novimethylophilus kurashikiensis TaxID=1825523 RepID=A0A2R5F7E2_9PROT|nr:putative DNA-binding domain-containing protein [Novimethylophilus kurashikiensis]GBG14107.1 uncharacterized protein NMK_1667 [Novimethylophilus kurashikiensis]
MRTLDFQQYQHAFTDYIRDPQQVCRPAGTKARGMKVYAEIVHANFDETLSACFPVSRKVLGKRVWTKLVRAFIAEHRCATPLFRQIPEAFLDYLQSAPCEDALPPFLANLAHYEWVELALALSDAVCPDDAWEPSGSLLDGIPVLASALMLLTYDFPVHRIGPRYKPTQADTEPTHIVAFRRPDHEVKFIVLNQLSIGLLQRIQQGESGRKALMNIAEELNHPQPEVILRGGLAILENLRAEQAILGARTT